MQYARFEKLVLLVGASAIIGAVALSMADGFPEMVELAAQGMLLLVLLVAVRTGRRGGLIAAIVASVIYIVLRIPALSATTMPGALLLIIASRLAAFGLVGVVGGELCSRVRYLMNGMENGVQIDDWSRVFNQRHACGELTKARSRFARYNEDFSVVMITLSPALFADLRPARQRSMVRAAADALRNDVRLVDEVARLSDGRFLILLPHTPLSGAQVVSARTGAHLRKTLGARDEAVRTEALSAATDLPRIDGLISGLAEGSDDQLVTSGSYNDSAERTVNPAETSASSAPASSTLSTSTAAVPEGSTKQ